MAMNNADLVLRAWLKCSLHSIFSCSLVYPLETSQSLHKVFKIDIHCRHPCAITGTNGVRFAVTWFGLQKQSLANNCYKCWGGTSRKTSSGSLLSIFFFFTDANKRMHKKQGIQVFRCPKSLATSFNNENFFAHLLAASLLHFNFNVP